TREVNGAVVICIHFIDHVLKLRFGRVLSQGAHDGAQFASGNLSYSTSIQHQVFVDDYVVGLRHIQNSHSCRDQSLRPGGTSTDHRHLYPAMRVSSVKYILNTFDGRATTYEQGESLLVLRD